MNNAGFVNATNTPPDIQNTAALSGARVIVPSVGLPAHERRRPTPAGNDNVENVARTALKEQEPVEVKKVDAPPPRDEVSSKGISYASKSDSVSSDSDSENDVSLNDEESQPKASCCARCNKWKVLGVIAGVLFAICAIAIVVLFLPATASLLASAGLVGGALVAAKGGAIAGAFVFLWISNFFVLNEKVS